MSDAPSVVTIRELLGVGLLLPASPSYGVGSGAGDGAVSAADGVGHSFVGADQGKEVSHARWWLSDLGSLGVHLGEGAGEYGQGLATRQSGRWSQDGIEASVSCSCGEKLGDPVVVGEQIALVDVEMFANRWVGEVEYVEVDGDASDAAAELERIDAVIDGVPEELGPRGLLLIGGVPDSGFILKVVPARSSGRVGAGREGVACRALVPPAPGQPPSRRGTDGVGKVHT